MALPIHFLVSASLLAATLFPFPATACTALLNQAFSPLMGGGQRSLCQYQGRVVLVVNTASEYGFTPQYEAQEALYRKYKDRGLVVLGFPANDFGGQEAGSDRQIAEFCRVNYGVSFPMFSKTSVSGPGANSLYTALAGASGEAPSWNFHKYLIDRSGTRVQSFPTRIAPDSAQLVGAIERLLAEP
jgi:glutathione peroxidase